MARPRAEGRRTGGKSPGGTGGGRSDVVVLYGWHPVREALANPVRHCRRLLATENALRRLEEEHVPMPLVPEIVRPAPSIGC